MKTTGVGSLMMGKRWWKGRRKLEEWHLESAIRSPKAKAVADDAPKTTREVDGRRIESRGTGFYFNRRRG